MYGAGVAARCEKSYSELYYSMRCALCQGGGGVCSRMRILPPSCRFPPLREGNRVRVQVPPRFARGTAHGFGSPCPQGEPEGADKGTSVRHRIAAAGAIFPSGCVGRQARRVALTPCVPLSRGAGEGERAAPLSHIVGEGLGVRAEKRARPANSEPERCALTPYVPLSRRVGEGERAAPLSHIVGEGLGVRAVRRGILSNTSGGRYSLS